MPVERERATHAHWLPKWIRHEHEARYSFANTYLDAKLTVDCACGDGSSSRIFAAKATRVLAYDVSAESIDEARTNDTPTNLTFAVADAVSLPLQDGTAGAYVSLETIEHLQDVEAYLREVVRVLTRDGLFICSTPNREVCNPGATLDSRPWNRFHVREFAQDEFEAVLKRYFDDVSMFGQNRRRRWTTTAKGRVGRHAPAHLVVRFNQVLKLPRLLFDSLESHRVRPVEPGFRYECLVAVCRGSRLPRDTEGAAL